MAAVVGVAGMVLTGLAVLGVPPTGVVGVALLCGVRPGVDVRVGVLGGTGVVVGAPVIVVAHTEAKRIPSGGIPGRRLTGSRTSRGDIIGRMSLVHCRGVTSLGSSRG